MSLEGLVFPYPWTVYSDKLRKRIDHLAHAGLFSDEEKKADGLRCVEGRMGDLLKGSEVRFYWLVDEKEGLIRAARFQTFGPSALLGASEACCVLLEGKNYEQARRMSAELIDKELRDKNGGPSFPHEVLYALRLVVGAIGNAAALCLDISLPEQYRAPPTSQVPQESGSGEGIPGFDALPLKEKIAAIEKVLDLEVRPYLAMDGGGMEVMDLVHNREVIISYHGTCCHCFASQGATLSYIQGMLRAKVHPELTVVPDILTRTREEGNVVSNGSSG